MHTEGVVPCMRYTVSNVLHLVQCVPYGPLLCILRWLAVRACVQALRGALEHGLGRHGRRGRHVRVRVQVHHREVLEGDAASGLQRGAGSGLQVRHALGSRRAPAQPTLLPVVPGPVNASSEACEAPSLGNRALDTLGARRCRIAW